MKHYRAEPASQPAIQLGTLPLLPLPIASGPPHPSLQVAAAPQTSAQSCDWRRRFPGVPQSFSDWWRRDGSVPPQVSVITACEGALRCSSERVLALPCCSSYPGLICTIYCLINTFFSSRSCMLLIHYLCSCCFFFFLKWDSYYFLHATLQDFIEQTQNSTRLAMVPQLLFILPSVAWRLLKRHLKLYHHLFQLNSSSARSFTYSKNPQLLVWKESIKTATYTLI